MGAQEYRGPPYFSPDSILYQGFHGTEGWKEDEEAVEDVEDDVEVTWHQSLLCFVVDIKMIIEKDETNMCIENKIRLSLFDHCITNALLMVS